MIRMAPAGPTVKGLDVSHYDGEIDFVKVKASGREFAFAKCTEYNADKTYAKNRQAAKFAGVMFGAYHFFHPGRDAQDQAEVFLSIAKLGPGDLTPVLDWESTDGTPTIADRKRARVWLDLVEKACGKPPIIYGSPYFLQDLGLDLSFRRYPLWIAHYGTTAPMVPKPWKAWAFWQHSEKGDVPGIPAPDEDLDVFNGTLDQLKQLTLGPQ